MTKTYFKIGLEKEFFLVHDGRPMLIPDGMPKDDCNLLVEARGNPYNDVVEAVYSLMADIERVELLNRKFAPIGSCARLTDAPFMPIDRSLALKALRQSGKGPIRYQNLYGYEDHFNPRNTMTAGIHISFTYPHVYSTKEGLNNSVNQLFDFPQLFRYLDNMFAVEIKAARRRPGFYEIKNDNRVEYRSLPANVDLKKLIEVLCKAPVLGCY